MSVNPQINVSLGSDSLNLNFSDASCFQKFAQNFPTFPAQKQSKQMVGQNSKSKIENETHSHKLILSFKDDCTSLAIILHVKEPNKILIYEKNIFHPYLSRQGLEVFEDLGNIFELFRDEMNYKVIQGEGIIEIKIIKLIGRISRVQVKQIKLQLKEIIQRKPEKIIDEREKQEIYKEVQMLKESLAELSLRNEKQKERFKQYCNEYVNDTVNEKLALMKEIFLQKDKLINQQKEIHQREIQPKIYSKYKAQFKIQVKIQQQMIKIRLSIPDGGLGFNIYESSFSQQNLAKMKIFSSTIQDMFELFSSQKYQVDEFTGRIKILDMQEEKMISIFQLEKKGNKDMYMVEENLKQKIKDLKLELKSEIKTVSFQLSQKISQLLSQKIQQQQRNIHQLAEKNEKQFSKIQHEINSKIRPIQKDILALMDNEIENYLELDEKIQKLGKNVEFTNSEFDKTFKKDIEQKDKRIKALKKEVDLKYQSFESFSEKIIEKWLSGEKFDLAIPYLHYFKVDGKRAEFIQNTSKTQILARKIIPNDELFRFWVKIINSTNGYICIGITDRKKQYFSQSSSFGKNSVSYIGNYYARSGIVSSTLIQKGFGFRENDLILVEVELLKKEIRWFNGKTKIAQIHLSMLAEESRQFVPFIEMQSKGDIIDFWD